MINENISNYRIVRLIGEGGMASVYEAVHRTFENRRVAIKLLKPVLSSNKNLRQRFVNEAKILASFTHPNIVHVLDFQEQNDTLAIIMDLLPGLNLSDYIRRYGALSEAQMLKIFTFTLDAFAFAHSNNVVHRDVKPSNIFILPDGTPKILDFGIAKLFTEQTELTSTGMQMGTLTYMSPEQVKDAKHIDLRTDIYSLGVTLYFALMGKPAYDLQTSSDYDVRKSIVEGVFPKLNVNSQYQSVIDGATAKNPSDRFQTALEFQTALKKAGKVQNYGSAKTNTNDTFKDSSKNWDKANDVSNNDDGYDDIEITLIEDFIETPKPKAPKNKAEKDDTWVEPSKNRFQHQAASSDFEPEIEILGVKNLNQNTPKATVKPRQKGTSKKDQNRIWIGIGITVFAVFVLFSLAKGCGPSAEEQALVQADSIRAADSIQKAAQEDSIAKSKNSRVYIDGTNGTFTDNRDGKIYTWVGIGTQIWMAENLAYKANSGCWAYNNGRSNVEKHGYLYTWETAKAVAPQGWHLPSKAEWEELELELGVSSSEIDTVQYKGNSTIAAKFKSRRSWENGYPGNNASGFNALASGWRDPSDMRFKGKGLGAYFWSSSPEGSDGGYVMGLEIDKVCAYSSTGAHSVRCVKDK